MTEYDSSIQNVPMIMLKLASEDFPRISHRNQFPQLEKNLYSKSLGLGF
jgi:hypothetical protein